MTRKHSDKSSRPPQRNEIILDVVRAWRAESLRFASALRELAAGHPAEPWADDARLAAQTITTATDRATAEIEDRAPSSAAEE